MHVCPGGVICAGLSCLDLQLVGASGEGTFESIKTFQQQVRDRPESVTAEMAVPSRVDADTVGHARYRRLP